jgi:hypothetical protein
MTATEAYAEQVREEAAKQIPTTWLDPLLSGPERIVGDPPYYGKDMERLLQALAQRIRALKVS